MTSASPSGVVVAPGELLAFAHSALQAAGLDPDSAAVAGDVLVRTSLRGVESHGVSYLHQYIKQLQLGGANPSAQPRTLVDAGAVALVDGDAGLGPSIAAQITSTAIERARRHGIAITSVRNANHFGAAGHYGLQCAEADCVGLVLSNTPPIMAATGARTRSIGNSPLSFGAPRTGAPPFVLDIAMSRVAGGKIRMAIQNGEQVPLGWILDPEGNATTDPEDFLVRRGALLPMENHKGYGLALMVEALAGALSGSAMLAGVQNWIYNPETPSDTGYFLLVIDVGKTSAFAEFPGRMAALCAEIVGAPLSPGVDRILIPGETEHEQEAAAHADGFAVRHEVWVKLLGIAADLGLAPPPSRV